MLLDAPSPKPGTACDALLCLYAAEMRAHITDALADDAPHQIGRPAKRRRHPSAKAPNATIDLPDQALLERLPGETDLLEHLADAGIATVGQLGLLALPILAGDRGPDESLQQFALIGATARALLGAPAAQVRTQMSIAGSDLLLSLDVASRHDRLFVETRLTGASAEALVDAEVEWPRWRPTGSQVEIVPRAIRCSASAQDSGQSQPIGAELDRELLAEPSESASLPELVALLRERIGTTKAPRIAAIALARLGLLDGTVPKLRHLASEYGLTRERVRQLEAKIHPPTRNRQAILSVLRRLAAALQRRYAPYQMVHSSVAVMLLQLGAGLTDASATAILDLLETWDRAIGSDSERPLFQPAAEPREISTGTLTGFLRHVVELLEDADGAMPVDMLIASTRAAPWSAAWPSALAERVVDVLLCSGEAALDGEQVICTQTRRRMTQRRRLALLERILGEAGRPLHVSEMSIRYNELVPDGSATRAHALSAFMTRFPETFRWCGPSTYGLSRWGVGLSSDQEELRAAGLAPARRSGAGDEIATFLLGCGKPVPLAAIEDHILERVQIRASSVLAALTQDRARRFLRDRDGNWGLRIWQNGETDEGDVYRRRSRTAAGSGEDTAGTSGRTLLTNQEQDLLASAALELLDRAEHGLRLGLVDVSESTRFQWAILEAVVGSRMNVEYLLHGLGGNDVPQFPRRSVRAVLDLV